MGWKQTKAFNQAKGGTAKGMCLRNVRLGYGILPRYNNATEAWNNTEQHKDRNVPMGVDVPLYYSWGRDGHINVRLANGRVWSDGDLYVSIEDYEAKKEPNFVGWGESVNEVRVIEHVADPVPSKMPPVGSKIQLLPKQVRNTFRAGTTVKAGDINVTDNSFIYTARGYDAKYPYRILINSASAGGDGVALALYYTNGVVIPMWKQV
jgi:uncharacterized Zn ribbon protein